MITNTDRLILRELAKRVEEIASLPIMEERRKLWSKHNRLDRVRPMLLVFPEGSWRELLPQDRLKCESEKARLIEWELLSRIYYYENIHDDTVIEKNWIVAKTITDSGWGLERHKKSSTEAHGAYGFDPVILNRSDLEKLKYPVIAYDADDSKKNHAQMVDLFGDILDVELKGITHISFHLMQDYIHLRGFEQVLIDMYDEPEMLHEAMSFFEEGNRSRVKQFMELNLLSLNNDGTYQSSGGVGYTDELPKSGFDSQRVRPCDMWASAESQEMAQVSPAMHREFAMEYERRLLEPFGLIGYGCCEDLTRKLDDVFAFPRMRRISISPWANVEKCAEKLKNNYIFSWKPNPVYLVGDFNEDRIREYVQHTLDVAKDCVLEIILKDTHTCEYHPERFTTFTDIVRELIEA